MKELSFLVKDTNIYRIQLNRQKLKINVTNVDKSFDIDEEIEIQLFNSLKKMIIELNLNILFPYNNKEAEEIFYEEFPIRQSTYLKPIQAIVKKFFPWHDNYNKFSFMFSGSAFASIFKNYYDNKEYDKSFKWIYSFKDIDIFYTSINFKNEFHFPSNESEYFSGFDKISIENNVKIDINNYSNYFFNNTKPINFIKISSVFQKFKSETNWEDYHTNILSFAATINKFDINGVQAGLIFDPSITNNFYFIVHKNFIDFLKIDQYIPNPNRIHIMTPFRLLQKSASKITKYPSIKQSKIILNIYKHILDNFENDFSYLKPMNLLIEKRVNIFDWLEFNNPFENQIKKHCTEGGLCILTTHQDCKIENLRELSL